MRHISFWLTTPQFRAREKDVTRRMGWKNLAAGAELMAVVKGQGLKAGEKVEHLGAIRVLSVRREALERMVEDEAYGKEECRREGYPQLSPIGFVMMFCSHQPKCQRSTVVTRIEFAYL